MLSCPSCPLLYFYSTDSQCFQPHLFQHVDSLDLLLWGNEIHNVIPLRIHFKLLLMTYKALHNLAPPYLTELPHRHTPTHTLISPDAILLFPPSGPSTDPGGKRLSPSLLPLSKTHSRKPFKTPPYSPHSRYHSRLICSTLLSVIDSHFSSCLFCSDFGLFVCLFVCTLCKASLRVLKSVIYYKCNVLLFLVLLKSFFFKIN